MNQGILSFNSGKLTPHIDARSDTDKYASGCRELMNMIPRAYGSATRRPGFEYVDNSSFNWADDITWNASPTAITTLAELQAMTLTGNYYLANNIDASATLTDTATYPYGFVPIGKVTGKVGNFTGQFNGRGHKITGLYMDHSGNVGATYHIAMFFVLSGAEVGNLILKDAYVKPLLAQQCAILATKITAASTIFNMQIDGEVVHGEGQSGGVVTTINSTGGASSFTSISADIAMTFGYSQNGGGPNGFAYSIAGGTFTDCSVHVSWTNSPQLAFGDWTYSPFARTISSGTLLRCSTSGVSLPLTQYNATARGGGFCDDATGSATFTDCYFQHTLNSRAFGGSDEQQLVRSYNVGGTVEAPTSGTWTLSFGGFTATIPWNAGRGTSGDPNMQTLLDATWGVGNLVYVSGWLGTSLGLRFIFRGSPYTRTNFAAVTVTKSLLPATIVSMDIQEITKGTYNGTANPEPVVRTYIGTVSNDARMVPFVYSSQVSYALRFGPNYIQVYYDGEPLYYDGTGDGYLDDIVFVTTPYAEEHLDELNLQQVGDSLFITHPNYRHSKFIRTSAYTFELQDAPFRGGPFMTRNDLVDPVDPSTDTMTFTGTTTKDGTGTLTSSVTFFNQLHVGSLFKLTTKRTTTHIKTDFKKKNTGPGAALDIKGVFHFETHGTWEGTVTIERNEATIGWETFRTWISTDDRNVQYTGAEKYDNVQYRVNCTEHDSGELKTELSVESTTIEGIVKVTSYTSPTVVSVTVISALDPTTGTTATKRWAEGAWSSYRGWPTSLCFFGDRAVYAGTIDNKNYGWLSEVGDYENFEEGTKDADPFIIPIPMSGEVRWVESIDTIVVGTTDEEIKIGSNKIETPITPTNFTIVKQGKHGSAFIQPVKAGKVLLFVDFVGRKVREMVFDFQKDKYMIPDLTQLAEDITLSGIRNIAFQRNPEPILWCVLNNGKLLSMSYNREEDVVAWAEHETDGDLMSVCVLSGEDEDEVWVSILRNMSSVGSTTFIERLGPRTDQDIEDSFFIDSGVSYTTSLAKAWVTGTTYYFGDIVSNGGWNYTCIYQATHTAAALFATDLAAGKWKTPLKHLIGESVSILSDGTVQAAQTVDSSGNITIPSGSKLLQIGLPYTYKLSPMRLDYTTPGEGTTHGAKKVINEIGISFYKTLNAKYGINATDLYDIEWEKEELATTKALFTGDVTVHLDGGFNTNDNIYISGSDPLPCTVRAIIPRVEKTGR